MFVIHSWAGSAYIPGFGDVAAIFALHLRVYGRTPRPDGRLALVYGVECPAPRRRP